MSQITRSASMISANMSFNVAGLHDLARRASGEADGPLSPERSKSVYPLELDLLAGGVLFPAERADDEGALHRVQAFPAGTQVSFSVAMTRCTRST